MFGMSFGLFASKIKKIQLEQPEKLKLLMESFDSLEAKHIEQLNTIRQMEKISLKRLMDIRDYKKEIRRVIRT